MRKAFLLLTSILSASSKRDKLARISPLARNEPSKDRGANTGRGKFKQRKGSLHVEELQAVGLSQISSINISFFEDQSSNIIFNWVSSSLYDQTDGENNTWYGEAMNGIGSMTIIQPHPSRFTGSVTFNDTLFAITGLSDGTMQVTAMNITNLPQESHYEDDVRVLPIRNKSSGRNLRRGSRIQTESVASAERDLASTDDGSIIDIMCIYTRQALCQEAVGADYCNITLYKYVMDDKCALAVTETNVAFNLSGVQTTLRLVHSNFMDLTYNESASFQQNVIDLISDSSSVFQRVRDLRDQYQADLVGLILNNPQSCGASPMYYNDEYFGYFSVCRSCMTGYYSFAHEIGHNLGCYHEMKQYTNPYPSASSYGYEDPNGAFRTIMSYTCSSNSNCPRIQRFSSPNRTFLVNKKTLTTGSTSANNVLQMNSVLYNVANYRKSSTTLGNSPTSKPISPSSKPITINPTRKPSKKPSNKPTFKPSTTPTTKSLPTKYPTNLSITSPTRYPTKVPSISPPKPLSVCTAQNTSCNVNQMTVIIRLDRPLVLNWKIMDQTTNEEFCSGGTYSLSKISPLSYCLQTGKSLKFQLSDTGKIGFFNSTSTYNITIRPYGSNTNLYYFTKKSAQNRTSFLRTHYFST